MGTPILLLKTVVQVQKTLGTAKIISAISKASAAVVTGTHDFLAGDYVIISGVVGMVEINDRVVRVLSVSTTVSFVCEALDSTDYTTYVSGGNATKITAFDTFANVTSFSYPEPAPNRIDVTTVHDTTQQQVFGLDSAPEISMPMLADPLDTAVINIRLASIAKATRAFKVTLQTGVILIMNAYVAGGRGFDGSVGAVGTSSLALTLVSDEQWFAS